jgi:hypothetical protein
MSADRRRAEYEMFLRIPRCCLDSWWGRPLRSTVETVADLESPAVQSMLTTMATRLKAANMHLESELSAVKSAVPTGKSAPLAEKLALLGHSTHGDLMSDRCKRAVWPHGVKAPAWICAFVLCLRSTVSRIVFFVYSGIAPFRRFVVSFTQAFECTVPRSHGGCPERFSRRVHTTRVGSHERPH